MIDFERASQLKLFAWTIKSRKVHIYKEKRGKRRLHHYIKYMVSLEGIEDLACFYTKSGLKITASTHTHTCFK